MSWLTPTSADVTDEMNTATLTAAQGRLAADGADPLPSILSDTVEECRGYIRGNPQNRIGAAGTIPSLALPHVIAVTRWRYLTRTGIKVLLSDSLKDAKDEAMRFFEKLSTGKVRVEIPETESDETSAPTRQGPTISANTRRFTRATQDGI